MTDPGAQSEVLAVTEIFTSIQGESSWAGRPCTFVRLRGCTVRCAYCDTEYACHRGGAMTIRAVLERCAELACPLVEITGGEPLEQAACPTLAQVLLDAGYTVLCETSGTRPINVLPDGVHVIMDLKCPGSGVCGKNDWSNLDALSQRDEVKFVLRDRRDYDWSLSAVRDYDLTARCRAVLLAPVFGELDPRDLAAWMIADGLEARLQLQLHKYIWPPDQEGV